MATQGIRYVSDEEGRPAEVIVPIDLWREIESERETAYLLQSSVMKRRLLDAMGRAPESLGTKLLRNLEFDPAAFEDLAWWIEHDRSQALRIVQLIRNVQRDRC